MGNSPHEHELRRRDRFLVIRINRAHNPPCQVVRLRAMAMHTWGILGRTRMYAAATTGVKIRDQQILVGPIGCISGRRSARARQLWSPTLATTRSPTCRWGGAKATATTTPSASEGLVCFQRSSGGPVPGCTGHDSVNAGHDPLSRKPIYYHVVRIQFLPSISQ